MTKTHKEIKDLSERLETFYYVDPEFQRGFDYAKEMYTDKIKECKLWIRNFIDLQEQMGIAESYQFRNKTLSEILKELTKTI